MGATTTHHETDKRTNRQTDKQTNRQTDQQTNRLTDKQTNRQTYKERQKEHVKYRQTTKSKTGRLGLIQTSKEILHIRKFQSNTQRQTNKNQKTKNHLKIGIKHKKGKR